MYNEKGLEQNILYFALVMITAVCLILIYANYRNLNQQAITPETTIPEQVPCGNGHCEAFESCSNCPADCGTCIVCGDGYCSSTESCSNCPKDCGTCPSYCGDDHCDVSESCQSCPTDCGVCVQKFSFTSYTNAQPYYENYCDKIDPYDLNVREAEAKAIKNDPGEYSVTQLFDIYDWVKNNIIYQNVPLGGIPYPASETLATGSGDCKNQAVLIASMIGAVGGTANVVIDNSCTHAYTIVLINASGNVSSAFTQAVATHYGNVQINTFTMNDSSTWIVFDPAGGKYPGNLLSSCTGDRTLYFVDSCRTCAMKYPNSPYTYGDKCYSECPQGTIHKNSYSCSPCSVDYPWSYNNECVTCPNGYSLYTNGKCGPN